MKRHTLRKSGLLGLVALFAFLCSPPHIGAQFDEEIPPNIEEEMLFPGAEKEQIPQYVEGEVLVKFKEGVSPDAVLQEVNLGAAGIERVHSIKPVVSKSKKDYKLEKDSDGWYWFRGKNYKEVEGISDEEVFKEAYGQMSPYEKSLYRSYKITLSKGETVEETVIELENNPNIEYAEPNYVYQALYVPTDSLYNQQWAHQITDAEQGWDKERGDPTVIIAVIDTGVDYNHEDLFENIWVNPSIVSDRNPDEIINMHDLDLDGNGSIDEAELSQYGSDKDVIGRDFVDYDTTACRDDPYCIVVSEEDYTAEDNDPSDYNGHGTHCAGIVGAVAGNNKGVVGVCHNCKIMPVRAGFSLRIATPLFIEVGVFDAEAISSAITYAADNGAQIISMSFGGYEHSETKKGAIDYAYFDKGVMLIAAAGNDSIDELHYPAAYDNVVAVSATAEDDTMAEYSNYGSWIDVAAPGGDDWKDSMILSTVPTTGGTLSDSSGYRALQGTSMATPYVAGLAGLMLSIDSELTNEQTLEIMRSFSDDLGIYGRDDYFGYGRVNVYRACMAVIEESISVEIVSPANEMYIKGNTEIRGNAFVAGDFEGYEIYYVPKGDPEQITSLVSSGLSVRDGTLAIWDTSECLDGEYVLTLKVLHNGDREVMRSIEVTVDNISQPPEIEPLTNKGAVIDKPLTFIVEVHDPDDPQTPEGQLEYSVANSPASAVWNTETHKFTWRPREADKGVYNVIFSVSDNEYTVEQPVTLTTVYMEETQITSASISGYSPAIYRDKIVWEDRRNSSIDIYMYDISTNQEIPITEDSYYQKDPDIYQHNIVWEDKRSGDNDIYMRSYDSSTGVLGLETQITNDPNSQYGPVIYQDKIVWNDLRSSVIDIYMYDLSGEKEIQLTNASDRQQRPDVYKDTIVWEDWRNRNYDNNYDIYMRTYDSSTEALGPEVQITQDSNKQSWPVISDDKILWHDDREGGKIYSYTPSTGETEMIAGLEGAPISAVYKDKICYGKNGDLYVYDLSVDRETQITMNGWYQFGDSDIYEDTVVWEDARSGSHHIYMARLYFAPQISAINPTTVSIDESFTIVGIGFGSTQGDSQVLFANGVPASIEHWSNTSITCRVPHNAQTGLVGVVTLGGESNGIYITMKPQISSISPNVTFVGNTITIIGSNFGLTQGNGYVELSDGGGVQIQSWSDTEIIFKITKSTGGSVEVFVVNDNGMSNGVSLTITLSWGDVSGNGSISAADTVMVLRFVEGMNTFTAEQERVADVTQNGEITTLDANIIARYIVQLITSLPVTNHAPDLSNPGNRAVTVGETLNIQLSASDPDGDTLSYSAANLPQGASFDEVTQTFSWAPTKTQVGGSQVTFIASDQEMEDSELITITVSLAWGDVSGNGSVSGMDAAMVSQYLLGLISFSDEQERVADVTQNGEITTLDVDVIARYAVGLIPSLPVTNHTPDLSNPGNRAVTVGETLNVQLSASDPDGDVLSYSAANLPQGASFDEATKTFSWSPTKEQVGTYSVTFTVTDAELSDSETITISVNPDLSPPEVTLTSPASDVTVSSSGFDFKGTAVDPSGVSEVRIYVYDYGRGTYTVVNQLASYNEDTQEWSFNVLSTHITPGQDVRLWVRARDTKGNYSSWINRVVRVEGSGDTTPPTVSISSPAAGATVSSSGFDFKGTAVDPSGVSEVRIYVYDYGKGTYTVVNQLATYNQDTQQWQFNVLSAHMTPGQYLLLYVRAKDTKGNSSYWKYIFVRVSN